MFVLFDGFNAAPTQVLARTLYRNVRQFTGIPVCVGVAPTRTLAKLANRAAKKLPGYNGVCVIPAEGDETRRLLERTALGEVWGVGRRLVERLAIQGIEIAWDLRQADPKAIRCRFSVTLERTVRELQGTPCIELNDTDRPRDRIMTSRSFGRLTGDLGELQAAIRQHAQRGAEKLRRQDSLARAVLVFHKTNRHRSDPPQYSPRVVVELPEPSDDSRSILTAARQGLEAIYRRGYRFMKGGVMLLDLMDTNRQQLSLLDTPERAAQRDRDHQLMAALDELNQEMGRGTVRLGMPSQNAAWHLRCARRTPRWTTNWLELPKAAT
ncbi:DinB/UmuC family translesion DNA polymerase [Halomonas maura]|uniref:DinB/UmuC family translesion DNA polymerase n=1 Tax=Halomonas maura TaxID=117606 RepID=UPI0025B59261|nr:DUF4113 domain-containing protein [Halomonas maura]MDN3555216.1 DUF4113 domain-containing protein [Halomonas maura]